MPWTTQVRVFLRRSQDILSTFGQVLIQTSSNRRRGAFDVTLRSLLEDTVRLKETSVFTVMCATEHELGERLTYAPAQCTPPRNFAIIDDRTYVIFTIVKSFLTHFAAHLRFWEKELGAWSAIRNLGQLQLISKSVTVFVIDIETFCIYMTVLLCSIGCVSNATAFTHVRHWIFDLICCIANLWSYFVYEYKDSLYTK